MISDALIPERRVSVPINDRIATKKNHELAVHRCRRYNSVEVSHDS